MKITYSDNAIYQVIFFIIFIFVCAINSGVIVGCYVALCIWALLGPKQAIQALSLNYLILLLNPAIAHLPGEIGLLRWLVLFLAAFRVLLFESKKAVRFLITLLFFIIAVIALSWITSPNFSISLMKSIVFFLCAGTVLSAYSSQEKSRLLELKKWFFCLTAAVVILSVPTILIPRIGYFRNGMGFQGIFNHPQAFGTFIAPVAAFTGANLLLGKGNKSYWSWLAGATLIILIFISKSRNALLTLIISIMLTYITTLFNKQRKAFNWSPNSAVLKIGTIVFGLTLFLAFSPKFAKTMEAFWMKSSYDKNAQSAFYNSRGSGIVFYWKHFLDSPLIGNGFGIDPGHQNDSKVATFMGIPISSPTEEGFLPMAFMSEVGVLGLICFLPFFLTLIYGALNSLSLGLTAMFFACLLVNIGEAIFFSPGQTGGYLWLLIGLCTANEWKIKK